VPFSRLFFILVLFYTHKYDILHMHCCRFSVNTVLLAIFLKCQLCIVSVALYLVLCVPLQGSHANEMLSGLKYFEMAIKKKPGADTLQEKVGFTFCSSLP